MLTWTQKIMIRLAGYIIEQLDRLPETGESVTTPDQIRLVELTKSKRTELKPFIFIFRSLCTARLSLTKMTKLTKLNINTQKEGLKQR